MSSKPLAKSRGEKRPVPIEEGEGSVAKRSKEEGLSILSLPDDVLLNIFSFLDTPDLSNLIHFNDRLGSVALDQSLWRTIDTTSNPLSIKDLRKLLKAFNKKTVSITIGGFLNRIPQMHHESITPSILETICERCPSLESIEFRHCFIDAAKLRLQQLPATLTHFGFVDCEVINISNTESYMYQMNLHLTKLKSLDLSRSPWLSNHSIMAISKCEKLEKLNLRNCYRMGEIFSYTALATTIGFRQLKWLDLRDTAVTDREVICFGRLPNITHLYLGHSSENRFIPVQDSEGNGIITDHVASALCPSAGDPHVSKLQVLAINFTRLSERGALRLIKGLPDLRTLDIRGSNIEAEKIAELSKIRKQCSVLF